MHPTSKSDRLCAYSLSTVGMATFNLSCTGKLMPETAFFATFRTMHPDRHASLDLQFRLRLLKFTVMFTRRSAPAEANIPAPTLQNLRHRRQEQAVCFRSGGNDFAALDLPDLTEYLAPLDVMESKKEHIGHESTPSNKMSETHHLFRPAISLLDTIPLFMAVSAAQISMQGGTITETWMRLAAGYMAQAVAEQYLVYASQRQEVLREAFSWGFDPECSAEEGSDDFQINAMFWGVDAVVDGWDRIRDEHTHAVSLNRDFWVRICLRALCCSSYPQRELTCKFTLRR